MDIGFLEESIIHMSIKREWNYINITRDYIGNFLKINNYDTVMVSRVTVSLSELLENAVQHSSHNAIHLKLQEKKEHDHKGISVSVTNYSDENHMTDLLSRLDEIHATTSLEYYVKCLRESKLRKKNALTPGCGLARIYHEGQAEISADFDKKRGIIEIRLFIAP